MPEVPSKTTALLTVKFWVHLEPVNGLAKVSTGQVL
jgi:hypothetical protein